MHIDLVTELFERQPAYLEAVRAWVLDRLRDASGDELVATVSWATPIIGIEPALAALSARPNPASTAADLVPLGRPTSSGRPSAPPTKTRARRLCARRWRPGRRST